MLNPTAQWISQPHPTFTKIGHISAVLTIFLSIFCLSMTPGGPLYALWTQYQRDQSDLAYLRETYLVKQGGTLEFGNYYLISLDGGRNWWDATAKYDDDDTRGRTVVINGPANPALLSHIQGIDALLEYTRQNGPIGSQPITSQDISILQNAGFTVEFKTPETSSP